MPADIKRLIAELSASEAAVRQAAAEQLARLGEAARPAAVALARHAADAEEAVREAVVSALEAIGPPAKEQLGELIALLKEGSADVVYWAATLIGRLQEAGSSAADALSRCLEESKDLAPRERAAWALGELGKGAAPAIDALKKAAAEASPRLARLAQKALERISG